MNTLVYASVDKPSHVSCSFLKLQHKWNIKKKTSTKQFLLNSNLQTFQLKVNLFFAGSLELQI